MFTRLLVWLGWAPQPSPPAPPSAVPDPIPSAELPTAAPESLSTAPTLIRPQPTPVVLERFDADATRSLVARALAGEDGRFPRAPDRAFLTSLARRVGEKSLCLPPFPAAAREVQKLLQEEQPRTLDLVLVIESDPGLLSRVLARASGAGYREPASRLDQAIARLGLDELWRLSWAACVRGLSLDLPAFRGASDDLLLHGRTVGEVTAWLANERRGAPYLAGLLHDVGKLVVFLAANNETDRDFALRIAEQHHAAVGAIVASTWQLAPEIAVAIAHHESPSPTHGLLARQLHLANLATRHVCGDEAVGEAEVEAARALLGTATPLDAILAKVQQVLDAEGDRAGAEATTPVPGSGLQVRFVAASGK